MSDRLKRRKKPGDSSSKEATKAPEPLQPRFYDDEPVAPVAVPAEVPGQVAPAVESGARRDRSLRPRQSPPRLHPRPWNRDRARLAAVADVEVAGDRVPVPAAAPVAAEPSAGEPSAAEPSAAEPAVPGRCRDVAASVEPPQVVPPQAGCPAQRLLRLRAGAAPAPVRASKGTVVLAIGLPGSGKSSWFKRHNIHPLSSDLLRELLFDDAQEQRFQDLVFSNLRSMLKARLIARRPMNYVDATNLTPHDRHSWIKLAKDYGYDVQGVFFDVPLEVCLERHQRRGRVVPEDVMRKMAGKLKPPTFEEGFSKITVVRVKQKEAARRVSAVGSSR